MVTVAIQDKYADTLTAFGDLEANVDMALQRYSVEQIVAKVSDLSRREAAYRHKYGMSFEQFSQRSARDGAFVERIEAQVEAMWEADLIEWEFCFKGKQDWKRKLDHLLAA